MPIEEKQENVYTCFSLADQTSSVSPWAGCPSHPRSITHNSMLFVGKSPGACRALKADKSILQGTQSQATSDGPKEQAGWEERGRM